MLPPLSRFLPRTHGATVLRCFQVADTTAFLALRSDAGLARFQGWTVPTPAEARAFVEEMAAARSLRPGGWVQLVIASAETGGLLGDVGVFLEADQREAEVGFTLGRAHQGQGHATRAVRAAVELIFEVGPVARIRAVTDGRNTAAVGVIERVGFVYSGELGAVFKGERCVERTFVLERPGG